MVTANPEIVLTALNDPEYSSVIKGADYLTADGIGIVKGAKILGSSLPGRVTGFDTMTAILKWCDEERKKIYFLGAKNEVITTMIEKSKQRTPESSSPAFMTDTSKTSQESFVKFSLRNPISFSVLWVFRSRNTLLKKQTRHRCHLDGNRRFFRRFSRLRRARSAMVDRSPHRVALSSL